MFDIRDKPNLVEKALLISAYFKRDDAEEAHDLMAELKDLVETLHIQVAETVTVFIRQVTSRHLTGSGKAAELMARAKELGCDCIVFDNALSPAQQRAWEEESGMAVIDRQEVILDIFNLRARTREARLQVAMARMEYSMPRLTRMWAHLDRQRGAGGTGGGGDGAARGMGESQLEVDRRLALKRLDKLKADLQEVKKQRDTQRKERSKVPVPHGAIVGYTNAGKSSLLNKLTQSDVLAEDKLFATLDTSTRRMELPDGQQVLLTDTVGFVRKLPHDLVQSFRATLEEAALADFLIHVVDASAASAEKFIATTTEVLEQIGAGGKKTILVFNKADLITEPERRQELLHRHPDAVMMSLITGEGVEDLLHRHPDAVMMSLITGEGVEDPLHRIHEMVFDRVVRLDLRLPMHRLDLLALAHEEGKVLHEEYDEDVAVVQCVVPKRLASRFEAFAVNAAPVRAV